MPSVFPKTNRGSLADRSRTAGDLRKGVGWRQLRASADWPECAQVPSRAYNAVRAVGTSPAGWSPVPSPAVLTLEALHSSQRIPAHPSASLALLPGPSLGLEVE
ncbi:hypothetical protein AB5N19_09205 [Seiridium cardinale]